MESEFVKKCQDTVIMLLYKSVYFVDIVVVTFRDVLHYQTESTILAANE